MTKSIKRSQLVNIIKEEIMRMNEDVADTAQLTIGTPRQTANNFDACSRQKYGYAESKDGKITMKESQFRKLVKECFMEVMKERKQLKESDEFKPTGYRTVSNLGGA